MRFDKKNKKVFRGSIFIPFSLNKYNNYLKSFENFLQNTPNKFLNSLKVRVHPLNKLSIVHQNFSKEINNLIKKYKKKFSKNNKNLCIFFGSATGVCVQALEEGNEIIHFPLNNTLDVFSSKIWKNLRVNEIKEGIFKYKILIKGKMFYTTYEKNKFQKYFLPILK